MKYIIGTMRPPFLPLAVSCAFLGLALAINAQAHVAVLPAVLVFAGAIAAHACVNAINEYTDIRSGLDTRTIRTPFSGGSGTLASDPSKAPYALWTAIATAAVTAIIGVFFAVKVGWPILIIGAAGLLVIFTYTPWLNKLPVLCLLAPGFGFGPLMVLGAFYALTGSLTPAAALASLIPFFLVSNLLLLNQFPDVEADKTVGRKHYPILIGRKASAVIFAIFTAAAYLVIILGVLLGLFPLWSLLGLGTLAFALPAVVGALQHPDDLPRLIPSLGQNVLLNLITPVLVGIGFLIG